MLAEEIGVGGAASFSFAILLNPDCKLTFSFGQIDSLAIPVNLACTFLEQNFMSVGFRIIVDYCRVVSAASSSRLSTNCYGWPF